MGNSLSSAGATLAIGASGAAYAGEEISGTVYLSVAKPCSASTLQILLVGRVRTPRRPSTPLSTTAPLPPFLRSLSRALTFC
eukprot:scaffold251214_cov36-Tisochrysis_lutea.AAC.3